MSTSSAMRLLPATLLSVVLWGCPPKTPVEGPPTADASTTTDTTTTTTTPDASAWEQELSSDQLHKQVNEAAAWLTTRKPEQAQQALTRLDKLSASAPDLAEIPYNQGVAYEILGNLDQARNRYLRATDIDPTLGNAWLNLGAIAERQGDLSRALQAYRAGLRNDPENPDLVVGVIGVLRKLGRQDEAISEAKAALARNANNIEVYNNLGQVYIEKGNLELAQFIYQKALNDIPGASQNARVHANLGRVYLLKEKTANARLELEEALRLDSSLVMAKMYLAELHMDNHDWASTVAVLEEALIQEPDTAAIHLNLGIGYRGLGELERAKSSYEKALALDPENPDPYLNLAVLLGDHMQSYDAALNALDTYVQRGGQRNALVTEWRADLTEAKEKYERALARQKKRDEAKKREELARQAKEEEARRQAEEEQRNSAAQPPTPEEPPAPEPAPEGSSGEGEGTPWGGAEPGTRTATADQILQAAAAGGTMGAGASCSALGSCGSLSLECAHDGVCRDVGRQGTLLMGVSCSATTDCAFGLECVSGACLTPQGGGGANPWGN